MKTGLVEAEFDACALVFESLACELVLLAVRARFFLLVATRGGRNQQEEGRNSRRRRNCFRRCY